MSENNIMIIDGHAAVIAYDPDIDMFRGEFSGLNGGADFYASSVRELKAEGAKSLREFLAVCEERGLDPVRKFSGKFNLRVDKGLHERLYTVAAAHDISMNRFVEGLLDEYINAQTVSDSKSSFLGRASGQWMPAVSIRRTSVHQVTKSAGAKSKKGKTKSSSASKR